MIIIEYNSPYIYNNGIEPNDTVYSDRLFQWDSKKYNKLCKKHFGDESQYWSNREPQKIESFLRDYIGNKKIILCRIEQQENKSTGYPLWRIDYKI